MRRNKFLCTAQPIVLEYNFKVFVEGCGAALSRCGKVSQGQHNFAELMYIWLKL